MKRTLTVIAALAAASLALVPSAAMASHSVARKKVPKPPVSGHWKVRALSASVQEATGGSFAVTPKHRAIAGLRATVGPDAETSCGTGTIRVLGKHKIYDAKGQSEFGAYNEWVVGKNKPNDDPVIQPSKVMLSRGGKHFKGRFQLVFTGPRGGGGSNGVITFNSHTGLGGCDFSFGVKKG